jgi:DNA-binding CsgD family transcriptional regulator
MTPVFDVRTALATYRVRATVYGVPSERDPLVLVSLERTSVALPSPDALRLRFVLTTAEARVALLLAEGHSNASIAEALGVRASTARRHTERVLYKLGVQTRAQVGPRIRQPWREED